MPQRQVEAGRKDSGRKENPMQIAPKSTQAHVRAAAASDAAAIAGLLAELARDMAGTCLADELILNAVDAMIDDGRHRVFVAEEAPGSLSGVAVIVLSPDFWTGQQAAELRALAVTHAARRRGVGSALLAAAADCARAENCAYLHLLAEPKNTAARRFFTAAGLQTKPAAYFELDLRTQPPT